MNRIVTAVSRLLDPPERECVRGDVEELGLSAPAAAADILGLVIRRQLAEWSHWGPWVALLGVAGVAGFYLSGSVVGVRSEFFIQIRTYLTYGIAYEPGGVSVAQDIAYTATSIIAMLLWSWACGFVLASLSRRALWMTSFFFYCVVRDSWVAHLVFEGKLILKHEFGVAMLLGLLPLDPIVIVFLLALVLGIRSARKGRLKQNIRLLLIAFGLTLVLLLTWMQSWFASGFAHWSGQAYVPTPFLYRMLPLLAAAWPLFSIPLLHRSRYRPAL